MRSLKTVLAGGLLAVSFSMANLARADGPHNAAVEIGRDLKNNFCNQFGAGLAPGKNAGTGASAVGSVLEAATTGKVGPAVVSFVDPKVSTAVTGVVTLVTPDPKLGGESPIEKVVRGHLIFSHPGAPH